MYSSGASDSSHHLARSVEDLEPDWEHPALVQALEHDMIDRRRVGHGKWPGRSRVDRYRRLVIPLVLTKLVDQFLQAIGKIYPQAVHGDPVVPVVGDLTCGHQQCVVPRMLTEYAEESSRQQRPVLADERSPKCRCVPR